MTDQEQIKAFLASRGVTRIAEGVATTTPREIYRAARAGEKARTIEEIETDKLIRQRRVTYDHLGRAVITNGLGEIIGRE